MKKSFYTLIAFLTFSLCAQAYTYQWNVPGDSYGKTYAGKNNTNYSSLRRDSIFRPATINGSEEEYNNALKKSRENKGQGRRYNYDRRHPKRK